MRIRARATYSSDPDEIQNKRRKQFNKIYIGLRIIILRLHD